MQTKEMLQTGCQKIAEQLQPFGFKSTQKGQLLKKISRDKKLKFEIYFQSSTKNWSGNVSIVPQILVSSDSLKNGKKKNIIATTKTESYFTQN